MGCPFATRRPPARADLRATARRRTRPDAGPGNGSPTRAARPPAHDRPAAPRRGPGTPPPDTPRAPRPPPHPYRLRHGLTVQQPRQRHQQMAGEHPRALLGDAAPLSGQRHQLRRHERRDLRPHLTTLTKEPDSAGRAGSPWPCRPSSRAGKATVTRNLDFSSQADTTISRLHFAAAFRRRISPPQCAPAFRRPGPGPAFPADSAATRSAAPPRDPESTRDPGRSQGINGATTRDDAAPPTPARHPPIAHAARRPPAGAATGGADGCCSWALLTGRFTRPPMAPAGRP